MESLVRKMTLQLLIKGQEKIEHIITDMKKMFAFSLSHFKFMETILVIAMLMLFPPQTPSA
jgi:hypothetical protein